MIISQNEIENITNNDKLNELYKDSIFMDIETTGLSRIYSNIISITILVYENGDCESRGCENGGCENMGYDNGGCKNMGYDNGGCKNMGYDNGIYKVYQVFCEHQSDEHAALEYIINIIKTKKFIITYNGNSFDIPFLVGKIKKYNLAFNFDYFVKIDLYNLIKQFRNQISTKDLKLQTIEKFFNIKRDDTLFGKDIINLYKAYKLRQRKEFLHLILRHNYEDVFNLPQLMNSIFELYDDVLYLKNMIITIKTNNISIEKNSLQCIFNVITNLNKDFIMYSINYNLNLYANSQLLKINIPLNFYKNEIFNIYYIDNNEYAIDVFSTIKGIKRNVLPIKINDNTYYDNIHNIVRKISVDTFELNFEESVSP